MIFENGDAVFYDMFLDVMVNENKEISILDEDELEEALQKKIITEEEFEIAKKTAQEIVDFYQKNPSSMYKRSR